MKKVLSVRFSNGSGTPSKAPRTQSETLRTPLNVPARPRWWLLWGIWGLWWQWRFFTASSQLWEFSFLSAVCRRHPLHKDLIEIGNIFFESTKQSSIIKWVANDSGVLLNIFNDLCVCAIDHHVPHRVCFKVPLVQVQVHLGYRLSGLGLGLGGLEQSLWVGSSRNFSSSPHRQVQVHLSCASVDLALTQGTWAESTKLVDFPTQLTCTGIYICCVPWQS